MRVSQLWHWIYHRGAREFSAMRNIARPLLDRLAERHTLARPDVVTEQVSADGTRKWLIRMPPAHAARQGRRNRMRLYSRDRTGHALRLEPGRLHAQLQLLPHRHDAARPQSDRGRNRRPGAGRARPARRFSGRRRAQRRARAFRRRRAGGVEHRLHGHGRAALQSCRRARRHRRFDRRRRPVAIASAHHRVDLRGRARNAAARRRMRDHARRFAARDQQFPARQAGAPQPQVPDRTASPGLPRLSRRFQRAAHHLRIRDAEGGQRHAGRGQGARPPAQGNSGQDQPHSVQPVARQPLSNARTGRRSNGFPKSYSTPATRARSARRAAATSSPPAAS